MNALDWISNHLEVVREKLPEVQTVCPFCGDTRGKFSFNIEKGVGRCWRASCDSRVTLAGLIARYEHIPIYLAAKKATNLQGKTETLERLVAEPSAIGALPSGCIAIKEVQSIWNNLQLEQQQTVEAGLSYLLNKRQVAYETLFKAQLGIGIEGEWTGRVILPAIETGQIVSVTGRLIEVELSKGFWVNHPEARGNKYKHLENNQGYLSKGEIIYGLDWAHNCEKLIVVEDSFSVLALGSRGIAAISFWGTDATETQVAKLNNRWKRTSSKIVVLLDKGAEQMAFKLAKKLSSIASISVSTLKGEDADVDLEGALRALNSAKPFDPVFQLESILQS